MFEPKWKIALALRNSLKLSVQPLLVGDNYYSSADMVNALNGKVLSRLKCTAVGYEEPELSSEKKRGRPKKYGTKLKLKAVLEACPKQRQVEVFVYGELKKATLSERIVRLRNHNKPVRVLLVQGLTQEGMMFFTNDLELSPEQMMTYKDFIGLGTAIFALFALSASSTTGPAIGFLFILAAFVMTPFAMKKLAVHLGRKRMLFLHRTGIGFLLFIVIAMLGAASNPPQVTQSYPTSPPVSTPTPTPESTEEPTPEPTEEPIPELVETAKIITEPQSCCKYCSEDIKPCGHACISLNKNCRKGRGCSLEITSLPSR